MDTRWRIELLGGLCAQQGHRTITRFRSRQTGALLAYLAFYRQRSHPREVLIELLWPGYDLDAGRNSLSTALSSLRHQLEPPGVPRGAVLVANWTSVRLNPEAVTTDVAEFEAALQAAATAISTWERRQNLDEAIQLYRGPLLPAYYDDWVVPEQQRLEEVFFQAARELLHLLQQEGDFPRALEYAGRVVAVDPLREEAHEELIRLHAATGQTAAALRQYRELERLLHKELGARPSAAIQHLAREIQRQSEGARPRGMPARPGGQLGQPAALERPPSGGTGRSPSLATPRSSALPSSSPLPAGTVTFLLTDVDASAALRRRVGEAGGAALQQRSLLRQAFRQHCGCEVQEARELFVVAFATARDAIAGALAGQRALAAQEWPAEISPSKLRMVLHTGDVELEAGSYRGPILHHAMGMLAAAHGGQVLCSEVTAALLRQGDSETAEPGVRLSDLGTYRLRDLPEPVRLFQVEYPEMEQRQFPPPRAEAGLAGNLPLQFTRFVGREKELARLRDLLLGEAGKRRGPHRLVTLTGPGGSGKTRLALELAGRVRDAFASRVPAGGCWFVSLADLSDSRLIPGAILEALRIPPAPQLEPLDQIAGALAGQPALLVLDNFEHLVTEGAPLVRTLLDQAPTLQCLVTSRQRLNVEGEMEFAVQPLSIPGGEMTPEQLTLYESVELFVDRAQVVLPDFQVTNANAPAVAELCRRLEGIPLAIELAAARAQVLTPAQMLRHLGQRLAFLVSRRRDAPRRHRTLREAIDWSYQLLAPELQRFLSALSIFSGGWRLEAAEAVCQEPLALDYLAQFKECSLVLAEEGALGMRFRMLEMLREFAAEQLKSEERSELRQTHAEYYLRIAEAAVAKHEEGGAPDPWAGLEAEQENFRVALGWGLEDHPEFALRLAGALGPLWLHLGSYAEGCGALTHALERTPNAPPNLRGTALSWAGELAQAQLDYRQARERFEELLAVQRGQGNQRVIAATLDSLAGVTGALGDYHKARSLLEEQLAIYRALEDQAGIRGSLHSLAALENDVGALRAMWEANLAEARQTGDKGGLAVCLNNLGIMISSQGDYAAARPLFVESLAIRRELDVDWTRFPLIHLGHLACRQGELAEARALLQESLAICRRLEDKRLIIECVEGLAEVGVKERQWERAARLFGAVQTLRQTAGWVRMPHDQAERDRDIASVRETLGETAFSAAWGAGRSMTWQQAADAGLQQ
jgi:predicted ATPase/DNA-binding SARP family transcriptional activator